MRPRLISKPHNFASKGGSMKSGIPGVHAVPETMQICGCFPDNSLAQLSLARDGPRGIPRASSRGQSPALARLCGGAQFERPLDLSIKSRRHLAQVLKAHIYIQDYI